MKAKLKAYLETVYSESRAHDEPKPNVQPAGAICTPTAPRC